MDTVTQTPGNNVTERSRHWVALLVALVAAIFVPFIGALIAAAISVWLYRTNASKALAVTCLGIALFFAVFYLLTTPADQFHLA